MNKKIHPLKLCAVLFVLLMITSCAKELDLELDAAETGALKVANKTDKNGSLTPMALDNMGKHKVPTLRNVGKKPGKGFPKACMHNGVFKSLKEVVHFYNTRDDGSWPASEVPENVNTVELGNLGLTDAEEDALAAFLETLSDGYWQN